MANIGIRCTRLALMAAFVSLTFFGAQPVVASQDSKIELILGVFPHLPPRELEKVYAPIAARFSAALGKKVLFRSASSFPKFMDKLDSEIYDIAMVQPFDYVRLADNYGYVPIVTRSEELSTIVVVPQESSLSQLSSLKGKTVALPPSMAAVSLLLKAELQEKGLIPGQDLKLTHHRSHMSCMQKVVIGEADACGTAAPALRFFSAKMKSNLKVIAKTTAIPHSLFTVHPRVSQADREKISQVLMTLHETEEGRVLMKLGKLKPFMPITDKDYDVVRAFNALTKE